MRGRRVDVGRDRMGGRAGVGEESEGREVREGVERREVGEKSGEGGGEEREEVEEA